MTTFLSGLESAGWLRHVRAVLEAAQFVAASVEEGVTVLIHCSDGWDRTSQTCALAELLLDSHYRTVHGFQVSSPPKSAASASVLLCVMSGWHV